MAHRLEIACFNASSAIHAANAGAHRIELCANYPLGGLTPSLTALQHIRAQTSTTTTPINIMIRPRAGDFSYTASEFAQMKAAIAQFKADSLAAPSGFVFGVLDAAGAAVDVARNRELVDLAAPLPCTFHRAFDGVADMRVAAAELVECGFAAVLTDGGGEGAVAGAAKIARLQAEFGERIVFIVGGGVRCGNVGELRRTGAVWYHSAAIMAPGEDVDVEEVKRLRACLDM